MACERGKQIHQPRVSPAAKDELTRGTSLALLPAKDGGAGMLALPFFQSDHAASEELHRRSFPTFGDPYEKVSIVIG